MAVFNQSGGQWGSSPWIGAAVVTSSGGAALAAIVNQITSTGPSSMNYSAFLASAATTRAILPDVRNNAAGWTSGVAVQNVGSSSTTVTLRANGSQVWSGTIGARASQTFSPVPGTSSGFSGAVTAESSGQPIVTIVNQLKSGSGDQAMSYNGVNR